MQGFAARFLGGSFVNITGTQRGVGQNGYHAGLHFNETARDVIHFLVAALLDDTDRARDQRRQQRRVAVADTHLTELGSRHQHLHQPGENFFLRADDIAVNCHCHLQTLLRKPYSLFAFSIASSIPPTM